MIADGKDNKEIDSSLSINIRTIANHASNILFKMKAKNRAVAVAIARTEGIID